MGPLCAGLTRCPFHVGAWRFIQRSERVDVPAELEYGLPLEWNHQSLADLSVPPGQSGQESRKGERMESKGLPRLLKRVNERLCELRADSLDGDAEFFCECGQNDCNEAIQLSPRTYLRTRGVFLLAPGHRNPQRELPLPMTVLVGPFASESTEVERRRRPPVALRPGV
jgi:hypothetical protein